jgi:hypothetical protein
MAAATQQPLSAPDSTRRPIRGAADWRKRLRRELQRVGAARASLYIDGPRGIARVHFPEHAGRIDVGVREALGLLRSLPDGAGVEATLKALGQT